MHIRGNIKPLVWESEFFVLNCGMIEFNDSADLLSTTELNQFDIVQAKVPADRLDLVDALSEMNFRMVEGEMDIVYSVTDKVNKLEYRVAELKDIPVLREIAATAFRFSRFRPPWYAEDGSGRFYALWVEKAVRGTFDDECLITHLTRQGRKRCRIARMKAQPIADLYSDYLLASFGATTATGLSQLLEGEVSHEQVTRYLAGTQKTAPELWRTVKPLVREIQSEAAVLIIDDSIEEKPYTDENDIVCWHYDHSKDRLLKGINFLTALYSSQGVSVPVGFHLVAKTGKYTDPKTQTEKRRSPVSKNAVCQDIIKQAVTNRSPFRFVLFAVWFASADTMVFIKQQQQRDFICPLKTTRKVALSQADKQQGRYGRVDTLELEAHATREVSLEGVDFPLLLVKQVFTHEDGSVGLRSLVSSDTTLSFAALTTSYHARWQVECYHKSLTQNVSLAKSPPQTVTTQTNHFFAALCGFITLERLKGQTKLNHLALKAKLYLNALHSAFSTLRQLMPLQAPA